jgi:hypothetical protein
MGYACPVCEVPQRDASHLADHLAFTAMLHGDDHETWLDEHAPEWASSSPADLAAVVADHALTAEYDEVFEDTVHGPDGSHDHDREGLPGGRSLPPGAAGPTVDAPTDEETRAVLEEARELTRQMYDDGEDEPPDRDGTPDRSDGGPDSDGPDGSADDASSGS